jgi:hypothetical protein
MQYTHTASPLHHSVFVYMQLSRREFLETNTLPAGCTYSTSNVHLFIHKYNTFVCLYVDERIDQHVYLYTYIRARAATE